MVTLLGLSVVGVGLFGLFIFICAMETDWSGRKKSVLISSAGMAACIFACVMIYMNAVVDFTVEIEGVAFYGQAHLEKFRGVVHNKNDYPVTIKCIVVETTMFWAAKENRWVKRLEPNEKEEFTFWADDYLLICVEGQVRAQLKGKDLLALSSETMSDRRRQNERTD